MSGILCIATYDAVLLTTVLNVEQEKIHNTGYNRESTTGYNTTD